MTDEETPKPISQPLAELEEMSDSDDEDTKKKKSKERTLWTRIWQGLGAASIGCACAAMAIERSALPIIAGVIAIIVGAVVIKFQFDLQDTDTLRRLQNKLRFEVNRLQKANDTLHSEVDELQVQVDKLETTEQKLEEITAQQGSNVNKLVSLVKENGTILKQMKEQLKAEAIQTLMSVVLSSDVDGSFVITGAEVDILMLRLQNVEGITLHEESFRKRIEGTDGSIETVLKVVKELHNDETPEGAQVLEIDVERVASTRAFAD